MEQNPEKLLLTYILNMSSKTHDPLPEDVWYRCHHTDNFESVREDIVAALAKMNLDFSPLADFDPRPTKTKASHYGLFIMFCKDKRMEWLKRLCDQPWFRGHHSNPQLVKRFSHWVMSSAVQARISIGVAEGILRAVLHTQGVPCPEEKMLSLLRRQMRRVNLKFGEEWLEPFRIGYMINSLPAKAASEGVTPSQ